MIYFTLTMVYRSHTSTERRAGHIGFVTDLLSCILHIEANQVLSKVAIEGDDVAFRYHFSTYRIWIATHDFRAIDSLDL